MRLRHNIVKVVYLSTQLSPRGSTATLTMLGVSNGPIQFQSARKILRDP